MKEIIGGEKEEEMIGKKAKAGFLFFGVLFLMMALIGVFVPGLTSEGIEIHPLYSQMDMVAANAIHILGNVFFAVIAVYLVLREKLKIRQPTAQLHRGVTRECEV